MSAETSRVIDRSCFGLVGPERGKRLEGGSVGRKAVSRTAIRTVTGRRTTPPSGRRHRCRAGVPEGGAKNPFGRPVFQGLQYSDTPTQPVVPLRFTDTTAGAGKKHTYRVIAVNTVGLKSKPSAE